MAEVHGEDLVVGIRYDPAGLQAAVFAAQAASKEIQAALNHAYETPALIPPKIPGIAPAVPGATTMPGGKAKIVGALAGRDVDMMNMVAVEEEMRRLQSVSAEMNRELYSKRAQGMDTKQLQADMRAVNTQIGGLRVQNQALRREMSAPINAPFKTIETTLSQSKAAYQSQYGAMGRATNTAGNYAMMGAGAGVAGLALGYEAAKGVAAYAEELQNLSVKTQLSTTYLQEFRYASISVGVNFEKVMGNMSIAQKNMLTAMTNGNSAQAKSYKALGVNVKDAATGGLRPFGEVLPEIISKLQNMNNGTERNALAMTMLGRGGKELTRILGMTAAQFDELRKKAHPLTPEQIEQAEKFKESLNQLEEEVKALSRSFGAELIPIIRDLLPVFEKLVIQPLKQVVQWFHSLTAEQKKNIAEWAMTSIKVMFATGVILKLLGPLFRLRTTLLQIIAQTPTAAATLSAVASGATATGTAAAGATVGLGAMAVSLGVVAGIAAGLIVTFAALGFAWVSWQEIKGRTAQTAINDQGTFEMQQSQQQRYGSVRQNMLKTAGGKAQWGAEYAATEKRLTKQAGFAQGMQDVPAEFQAQMRKHVGYMAGSEAKVIAAYNKTLRDNIENAVQGHLINTFGSKIGAYQKPTIASKEPKAPGYEPDWSVYDKQPKAHRGGGGRGSGRSSSQDDAEPAARDRILQAGQSIWGSNSEYEAGMQYAMGKTGYHAPAATHASLSSALAKSGTKTMSGALQIGAAKTATSSAFATAALPKSEKPTMNLYLVSDNAAFSEFIKSATSQEVEVILHKEKIRGRLGAGVTRHG